MNVLTCLIIGALASGRALAGTSAEVAPAQVHTATGLTLELVADADAVVPGRPLAVGLVLRPAAGFHTYWRQPGLVGLTPSVEWSWPAGISAGEMLWPEPQRGMMAAYGVWCLKRDVCLVTPVTVPTTLDPATVRGPYPVGANLEVRVIRMAGGAHTLATVDGRPFGAKVYGVAAYTSYMYSGGLNLAPINPPG